jgi:hypothetical protein
LMWETGILHILTGSPDEQSDRKLSRTTSAIPTICSWSGKEQAVALLHLHQVLLRRVMNGQASPLAPILTCWSTTTSRVPI